MNKKESLALKGVAILMMVFYHLFCREHLANQCEFLFSIDGLSGARIIYTFAKCLNPVNLYLILSGYGLYVVIQRGGDNKRWTRLRKLLIHYWIITIPFVLLGCFLKSDIYPGDWIILVANITAFKCTYNTECWFLLPYIILSLLAGGMYKMCNRFNGILVFGTSFLISLLAAFSIYYLRPEFMAEHQVFNLLYLVATLQHPFVIGMLACKYDVFNKIKIKPILAFFLLLLVVFARVLTSNLWHTYYVFILLFLLLQIMRRNDCNFIHTCLEKFGKHSLNIWMIHSWFCYHLFQDQLYAMKDPIVIFMVTLLFSCLISVVIDFIIDKVCKQKIFKLIL